MLFNALKFSVLNLLFATPVFATELYEPTQTIRQLGMGGVYVFHENDGGSFVQNPAYSCFTKGLNWSVANIDVAVGDIADAESMATLIEEQGTPTASNLSEFMGKDIYLKVGAFSSLTLPCFGTALYYNATTSFSVQNPAYPRIETFYQTDTAFSVGGGFSLGPLLAFGMDVKKVMRKGGPVTFGPESISLLDEDGALQNMIQSVQNGGEAYGLDIGLVSRLSDIPLNPTVSLSWKDIGSTAFVKTTGNDSPPRQKDNMVLGATFDASIPFFGLAGGFEYRHITNNDEQIGKKIHLGAELSVPFIDLRAGLYQGYPTYGAAIDFWLMQFEASLYTVEKGVYPGQTPEQRGQVGLTMSLEFDPNFKLMDSGGKKRRLKQRR